MEVIRRYTPGTLDLIQRSDGSTSLSGYAIIFWNGQPETEFRISPRLTERITKDAVRNTDFSKTILRFNHSSDFDLGDKSTGLQIGIDDKGVWYSHPFDNEDVDFLKVKAKLKKNLIRGSSIRGTSAYRLEMEGNTVVRWLTNIVELEDLGPVDRACYPGTTAMVRSASDADVAQLEQEAEDFARRQKRTNEIKNRLKRDI